MKPFSFSSMSIRKTRRRKGLSGPSAGGEDVVGAGVEGSVQPIIARVRNVVDEEIQIK